LFDLCEALTVCCCCCCCCTRSFIDDSGAVKVGDFGLSRESSDTASNESPESILNETFENGDITAGVGTRSYASPEQMNGGTDYDSSTDVYSLGIILFELCYPMYTVSDCRTSLL
jgi:serine/threonine protein kinase